MKILIDGDACPVKAEIMAAAETFDLEVVLVHSISHFGYSCDYKKVEKIVVDNESQAADMAIINKVTQNDIVITGDFGLASLVLSKKAYAISFDGRTFNEENMDRLLFERFLSSEIRRNGGRLKGPQKRTIRDNDTFKTSLINLILKIMKEI